MTGETIYGDDGYEYELVDEDAYYSEEEIEAIVAQREQQRELEYERYLDHLEHLVEIGERQKGRPFTNQEVEVFVSEYIGDGPNEHGHGDVDAAVDAVQSFSNLDDREERRQYMAQRLQEDNPSEIHSSGGPGSDSAGEGGDYYEDGE